MAPPVTAAEARRRMSQTLPSFGVRGAWRNNGGPGGVPPRVAHSPDSALHQGAPLALSMSNAAPKPGGSSSLGGAKFPVHNASTPNLHLNNALPRIPRAASAEDFGLKSVPPGAARSVGSAACRELPPTGGSGVAADRRRGADTTNTQPQPPSQGFGCSGIPSLGAWELRPNAAERGRESSSSGTPPTLPSTGNQPSEARERSAPGASASPPPSNGWELPRNTPPPGQEQLPGPDAGMAPQPTTTPPDIDFGGSGQNWFGLPTPGGLVGFASPAQLGAETNAWGAAEKQQQQQRLSTRTVPQVGYGPVFEDSSGGWVSSPPTSEERERALCMENGQLRRELEQLQVSLLQSLRRQDRFISGGQFKGKRSSQNHEQVNGSGATPNVPTGPTREELRRVKHQYQELFRDHERLLVELRNSQETIVELRRPKVQQDEEREKFLEKAKKEWEEKSSRKLEEARREKEAAVVAERGRQEKALFEERRALDKARRDAEAARADGREKAERIRIFEEELRKAQENQADSEERRVALGRNLDAEIEALKARLLSLEAERDALLSRRHALENEVSSLSGLYRRAEGLRAETEQSRDELLRERQELQARFGSEEQERDAIQRTLQEREESLARERRRSEEAELSAQCRRASVGNCMMRFCNGESEGLNRAKLALMLRSWQLEVRGERERRRLAADQAVSQALRGDVEDMARREEEAKKNASGAEEEVGKLKDTIAQLKKEARSAKMEAERARSEALKNEGLAQKRVGEEMHRQNEAMERLRQSLVASEARNAELEAKLKTQAGLSQEKEAQLKAMETELAQALARCRGLEAKNRELEQKLGTMTAQEGQIAGEQATLLKRAEERAQIAEQGLHRAERETAQKTQGLSEAQQELDKKQAEVFELQRRIKAMDKELDEVQQAALKSKLQQMMRLQVLAPRVSVSIGGQNAVDLEGAPPAGQIRKLMLEKVLPRFSKVIFQETEARAGARKAEDEEKTQQYVQKVMGEMVTSIEEKLQGVLGDKCVRTSY